MAKTAELKDRFNQLNIDVWYYDFADGGGVADGVLTLLGDDDIESKKKYDITDSYVSIQLVI